MMSLITVVYKRMPHIVHVWLCSVGYLDQYQCKLLIFPSSPPHGVPHAIAMQIIGKASARLLIHLGAIEMVATILICYAVAVKEGHVKPWLPTISACGEQPPEVFLFRYGIVTGAILLIVEAIALYGAGLSSKLIMVLGTVASFCLGVVGVVSAREVPVVHTSESGLSISL